MGYENWVHPAAVVLVVPTALTGVLPALRGRDLENRLSTQVGLVLMIALASKNAILALEYACHLCQQGLEPEAAAAAHYDDLFCLYYRRLAPAFLPAVPGQPVSRPLAQWFSAACKL